MPVHGNNHTKNCHVWYIPKQCTIPYQEMPWSVDVHRIPVSYLKLSCLVHTSRMCNWQFLEMSSDVWYMSCSRYKTAFVVTLSQISMFSGYYICKIMHCYCMLFDTSRCELFTDVQWLLTARYWL